MNRSRSDYRAASAEAEIRELARQAKDAISKMAVRSAIIEAAMRVLMKHDLLNEFSQELNNPPDPSITRDDIEEPSPFYKP